MDDTRTPNTFESVANERSWQDAIERGISNRGNLQANLSFLKQTDLINANKKVLELGCGTGALAHFLHTTGTAVIGSDIAKTAIDHARKCYPETEFRTHSAEELPYEDGSFDIVMSFDVLEHLPNVDQHLREVRRVVKADGYY
ncbi:MAG: class I SAM-dependent methyltransferase, partial [Planctomycetota bacterium]